MHRMWTLGESLSQLIDQFMTNSTVWCANRLTIEEEKTNIDYTYKERAATPEFQSDISSASGTHCHTCFVDKLSIRHKYLRIFAATKKVSTKVICFLFCLNQINILYFFLRRWKYQYPSNDFHWRKKACSLRTIYLIWNGQKLVF